MTIYDFGFKVYCVYCT